ncbi:E3 ubiquitin-protein ligase TRIM39-like [Aplochiton taeniatus]
MATSGSLQSEDYFLCSICLEVFTEPVSIACGHNFCKACICNYWNSTDHCQCPLCKRVFNVRPDLSVNTFISELVAQFKLSARGRDVANGADQQAIEPGEVSCDVCTGTKFEALKSCLECLTSYCQTHLEPHHIAPALKRHNLIDPVHNLENRVCKQHNRPLELFCQTDQVCVCHVCAELLHKYHKTVPLHKEYEKRKSLLEKAAAKAKQMIQIKMRKFREIENGVQLSKTEAERQVNESERAFSALVASVLSAQAELGRAIEEHQRETEEEALECAAELQLEVGNLQKTCAELELLQHDDHLQFLQSFPARSALPRITDWSGFDVCVHPKVRGTAKVLSNYICDLELARGKLSSKIQELSEVKYLSYAEMKRMQRFEVDVLLDSDTAHPHLILSRNRKEVSYCDMIQRTSINPNTFTCHYAVMGQAGFFSGKFYFEVQVKGKIEWLVGVARGSICRTTSLDNGPECGLWAIELKNGRYKALPSIPINHTKVVQTMGVFVDCEMGKVLFYDVENRYHMFSFTGNTFNDNIYPFLIPCDNEDGPNSAPLVICPLHNDE